MAQGIFNLKQVNQAIRQKAWTGIYAPTFVEYLVVAGGGGGSGNDNNGWGSGGGGAGGLRTGIIPVTAGTSYAVTVGSGGATTAGPTNASSGTDSVFSTIISVGGGYGAVTTTDRAAGGNGGSGGGGSGLGLGGTASTSFQGNNGGNGASPSTYGGGGGGGAGSAGGNGLPGGTGTSAGGKGGAGIGSSISGTVITYAGGGGGSTYNVAFPAGAGGSGGGGNGGSDGNGTNGIANSGGGGGGGGASAPTKTGGIGGSGIVIVRYQGTVQFYTGGTVGYANGYIVHTFYSNGTLAPTTPTQYSNTYQISRSLRFNKPDTTYLNRTPGSASNRKTYTWSGWIKRSDFSNDQVLFFAGTAGDNDTIRFETGNTIYVFRYNGAFAWELNTTQVFRDPSAWYHIVVAVDTTQSTNSSRVKLYVNGTQVTTFSTATYPTLNFNSNVNSAVDHRMGNNTATNQFSGYMTDVHFIDGQALTPSSFGEYDINTGVWIPRSYGGSYGTNGFKLNFSDNSNVTAATLGADTSGNGNNFTPNNFSVTAGVGNDSFVDTPTPYGTDTGVGGEVRGNYATWNPLQSPSSEHGGNGFHLANGNLQTGDGTDLYYSVYTTLRTTSGKFYIEKNYTDATSWSGLGLYRVSNGSYAVISSYFTPYLLGGGDFSNNTSSNAFAWGYSISNTDTISMAVDYDNRAVWFAINGVWIDGNGSQSSATVLAQIIAGDTSSAAFTWASGIDDIIIYSRDRNSTAHTNFGQRAYTYTAPTGFKALCTTNLPTPTIGATAATRANKYFNAVTYTGAGGTQAVNVGFQPDFVWMKSRSNSSTSHILQNAVTGVTKGLQSNVTDPEFTDGTTLTEFNSAGFKVGGNSQTNLSTYTYVAWNWKANGAGVTNTDGSITSTVSANPTAGFSIVTYASTTGTVGHGLGVAPSVIIMKGRNVTDQWAVYHISKGNTIAIPFSTGVGDVNSAFWNNTTPTSTVFSQGSWDDGYNKVAYCFAPVAGYSAFGTYTGNGSGDGPFVFTGMRPAFVMLKNTTNSGNDWQMIDVVRGTYNVLGPTLVANGTGAENTYTICDFLSNGVKFRDTNQAWNASSSVYIYMAFASNPLKYSLAR